MNKLSVCAAIFRIILSHMYLSSGKVSSESEMGHVPPFEILVHLTWYDPIFLWLCNISGERLQPTFRQFVNLIKHYQQNSTLVEILVITWWVKKKNRNWSILMTSQDNTIVISCDQPLLRSSFSLIQTCLQFF